jgi:hypothetical protein
MTEDELKIAQKLLPRDWTPLVDVVLGVGAFFKRDLDLVMINRYLHEEVLELMLVRPDGTTTRFSKEDCKHRTVHAPFHRAEGVRVEPFEAGRYLARLAESISSATTTLPADRQLPAEGETEPAARVEAPMPEPVPPAESVLAPPTESSRVEPVPPPEPAPAADVGDRAEAAAAGTQPESNWSAETFLREWVKPRPVQQTIVKALPKLYGDNIAAVLDGFTSTKPFQAANLRRDLKKLMQDEARPGRPVRDSDVPSPETCGRFLTAWHEFRTKQRVRNR